MAAIRIERHPTESIIYVRWPETYDLVQASVALETYRIELLQQPYSAVINDARQFRLTKTLNRAMHDTVSDFLDRETPLLRERVACWAAVTEDPTVQLFLDRIEVVPERPYPTAIFATLPEAEAWCHRQLAEQVRAEMAVRRR